MKIIITIMISMFMFACQNNQVAKINKIQPVLTSPQISVQLWSVRDDLKKDFKGTLEALASMGFDGVEFAGYFGPYKDNAKGLKKYLDEIGLEVSGAHINFNDFFGDKLANSVAFYQTLDTDMLIVGGDPRSASADHIDDLVADLLKLSKNLAPFGIKAGFHNHEHEFNDYKNSTFWDHIAMSTPQDMILQLDIGWVMYADQDPVEYVNKYPGRTLTSHYKPKLPRNGDTDGKLPLIGQDLTPWLKVIEAERNTGGTLWFVVEQEDYPDGLTPLEAVKISKLGLDKIIAGS